MADGDCDDGDSSIHPGAAEVVADGVDQNCDGGDTYYRDRDRDGYGSLERLKSANLSCQDYGESSVSTDCDDADPDIHPGATELVADRIDQDCDGGDLCYEDADEDGYGAEDTVASKDLDCSDAGESSEDTDCDDTDPATYEGAEEIVADGIDEDCDGGEECYLDSDEDGWGTSSTHPSSTLDCTGRRDSPYGTDCDDDNPDVHPGATEVCGDGADGDCDGVVDGPPSCEDCNDGIDDDGDGLVDCDDDDCWGFACHPAGVRARVRSGSFEVNLSRRSRLTSGCGFTPVCGPGAWGVWSMYWLNTAYLRSVSGTVQVLPSGAPSWDVTTAHTTCAWSVASATIRAWDLRLAWESDGGACMPDWGSVYRVGSEYPFRGGVAVEPGCRLATATAFLPALLAPAICGADEVGRVIYEGLPVFWPYVSCSWDGWWEHTAFAGPLWYAGRPVLVDRTTARGTTTTTESGTTYCPEHDETRFSTVRRHYTGVLDPGSVYTALP